MLLDHTLDSEVHSLFDHVCIKEMMEKRQLRLNSFIKIIETSKFRKEGYKESCIPFYRDYTNLNNTGRSFIGYRYHEYLEISDENMGLIKKDNDCSGWLFLMEKSGLYHYMDKKSKEEWEGIINRGDFLELNCKNIVDTFRPYFNNKEKMFNSSVLDLFKSISWDRENNKPLEIKRKIITSRNDVLDNLIRIFCILNKKPQLNINMYSAVRAVCRNEGDKWECDDFFIRWYNNGNYHVIFKDSPNLKFNVTLKNINNIAMSEYAKNINDK